MILSIETIERERIKLTLVDRLLRPADGGARNDSTKCYEFETQDQSADLLTVIDKVLKNHSSRLARTVTLKDLTAILVNQGPGSYTGVRIGATVANTLAWSLDIPVYGFKNGELDKKFAEITKSSEKKFSKIVTPIYE